jgi:hypothetical protein
MSLYNVTDTDSEGYSTALADWLKGACGASGTPKCSRDDAAEWTQVLNTHCMASVDAEKPVIRALHKTFSEYDSVYLPYMTLGCGLMQ